MKLYGTAYIINDPEEINLPECLDETIKHQALKNEFLLITIQIHQAEYVEKSPLNVSTKKNLNQVKNKFYHWFQSSKTHLEMDYHNHIPVKLKIHSFSSLSN